MMTRFLLTAFAISLLHASDEAPQRLKETLEERATTARAAKMKTDDRITFYQELLHSRPGIARYKILLAGSLLQKMRETTDFGYVKRASQIVDDVLKADPANYDALRLRTAIQLEYHLFLDAAESSRQSIKMAPYDPLNYGTLADAMIERGDYDAGADALQKMVDLRPDLTSYNRIAHYKFLNNDVPGAIDIMKRAITSGSSAAENVAWCLVELGNIYFKSGRLDDAEAAFTDALRLFPPYHQALAGMGRVLAAKGRTAEAIVSYKRAQAMTPLPDYNAALFDLYSAAGRKQEAERERQSIEIVDKLMQANGEKVNRNLSLIYSDHDWSRARALELARNELAYRQDVYTFDALAWALYRNANFAGAYDAAAKAMKLNTPEPQFYFHAGLIAGALGKDAEAGQLWKKAVQLDPVWPKPLGGK